MVVVVVDEIVRLHFAQSTFSTLKGKVSLDSIPKFALCAAKKI